MPFGLRRLPAVVQGGIASQPVKLLPQGPRAAFKKRRDIVAQLAKCFIGEGSERRLLVVGKGRQRRMLAFQMAQDVLQAVLDAGKIAGAGLTDRIETAGGSFFEQLPKDHDVHLLSMILHDWDEAKNRALLRRSFEALPSGGAVVISELLVNDEKTGPASAVASFRTVSVVMIPRAAFSSAIRDWRPQRGAHCRGWGIATSRSKSAMAARAGQSTRPSTPSTMTRSARPAAMNAYA